MGADSKKLRGASKVSRAVWPERLRWNLATDRTAQWRRAMMIRRFYQPGEQRPRKSHNSQRNKKVVPPSHRRIGSFMFRVHRRVALSLPIIIVLLVVCLWQRWYVQLILAALCTATNVLVLHLLFNDVTVSTELTGRATIPLPRTAPTAPPGKSSTAAKPISNRPLPTMTFPDTPMPATPLIRVLETIDLSSTNVEHFLEMADRAERTETAPPSQEPPRQSLE